jgi:hypothetical protein
MLYVTRLDREPLDKVQLSTDYHRNGGWRKHGGRRGRAAACSARHSFRRCSPPSARRAAVADCVLAQASVYAARQPPRVNDVQPARLG